MGDLKVVTTGIADAQKLGSAGDNKVTVGEAKAIITNALAKGLTDTEIKGAFKKAGHDVEKSYNAAVKELTADKAKPTPVSDKAYVELIGIDSNNAGGDFRAAYKDKPEGKALTEGKESINRNWKDMKQSDQWEFAKGLADYDHSMNSAGQGHTDPYQTKAKNMTYAAEISRELTAYKGAWDKSSNKTSGGNRPFDDNGNVVPNGSQVTGMMTSQSIDTIKSDDFKAGLTNAIKENPYVRDSVIAAYKETLNVKTMDGATEAANKVMEQCLKDAGVDLTKI